MPLPAGWTSARLTSSNTPLTSHQLIFARFEPLPTPPLPPAGEPPSTISTISKCATPPLATALESTRSFVFHSLSPAPPGSTDTQPTSGQSSAVRIAEFFSSSYPASTLSNHNPPPRKSKNRPQSPSNTCFACL